MQQLEADLRYLGVLEKAIRIHRELGAEAASQYVRSAYRLLSKVYHPDLNSDRRSQAEEGQRRLNEIKQRLDWTSDSELARFLGGAARKAPAGHPRVLVVEDEDGLNENLCEILSLEGYHVSSAPNGIRGLKEQLMFRPELVISDVVMPLMDGVEMVKQMRVRDPEIKVIFISGFFGSRSIKSDLQQIIDSYGYPKLAKPFRPSQLLSLVREAIG